MKLTIAILTALLTGCSSITGAPVAEPPPAISMEERAADFVRSHIQQSMDTDKVFSPLKLKITDVLVVHSHGNFYKGMVTVRTFAGTTRDIAVGITADNDNFILETERGVLAWAFDDGYPPGTADSPTPLPVFDGWSSLVTKTGKTECSLADDIVQCQVQFDPPIFIGGEYISGVKLRPDGSHAWARGEIPGDSNRISYGFYRAMTWTIDASAAGTRFTHDNGTTFLVSTSGVIPG